MKGQTLPETSTRSRAAIRGHPLHPMILPFPLVFLTSVLLSDLGYLLSGDPFWARAGFYLLLGGVVTGLLAAVPGVIDFSSIKQARTNSVGWLHALGNAAALVLAAVNLILRWGEPVAAILPWGLTLSVLTALLLGVTGWAGGELSYRYRVGVDDMEPHTDPG